VTGDLRSRPLLPSGLIHTNPFPSRGVECGPRAHCRRGFAPVFFFDQVNRCAVRPVPPLRGPPDPRSLLHDPLMPLLFSIVPSRFIYFAIAIDAPPVSSCISSPLLEPLHPPSCPLTPLPRTAPVPPGPPLFLRRFIPSGSLSRSVSTLVVLATPSPFPLDTPTVHVLNPRVSHLCVRVYGIRPWSPGPFLRITIPL